MSIGNIAERYSPSIRELLRNMIREMNMELAREAVQGLDISINTTITTHRTQGGQVEGLALANAGIEITITHSY